MKDCKRCNTGMEGEGDLKTLARRAALILSYFMVMERRACPSTVQAPSIQGSTPPLYNTPYPRDQII
ncbi:hypothetical protein E2C01_080555 [Portunus trituberculatus]|uniref:Uncharacterized protein n=1 Tax=Portunus trituberculatus TaxID=210409 RepID=A0A5B7ITS0_PORTR|nr:hypothetical protein [Portunus trituberculatus]